MSRSRSPATTAVLLILASWSGTGSAGAATPWIDHEFMAKTAMPLRDIETFLNHRCRPSGLDGIQFFAVQKGHGDTQFLHLYCRADHRKARYRVSLPTFKRGGFDALVKPLLQQGRTRIGPFHFGAEGQDDGLLLIEQVR